MLRKFLHEFGLVQTTLLTTLAAILLSIIITAAINYAVYRQVGIISMIIATLVPALLGPTFGATFLRIIAQLDTAERQLRQIVMIDQLTGAHTRRHFFELAPTLLTETNAAQEPIALAVLDIDKFKNINDTQGHLAGDDALRSLGLTCLNQLQPNMVFSRFGGDEFIILCPNTTLQEIQTIAEEIQKYLNIDQATYTLSIGITASTPPHPNIETLIAQADQALYEAKRQGGNTVVVKA